VGRNGVQELLVREAGDHEPGSWSATACSHCLHCGGLYWCPWDP
jgi:hypothetical protein